MSFEIILAEKNNPDHTRAIKRLWDNNLRFIADGRYEWLYQDNPAGETITCLAVNQDAGIIVGMASAMCRDFYLKGRCYTAGIAIDFAIDEEYRVFGPALQLQRALANQAWEHDLDLMLAFPNLASQGIFKRLGYKRIGENLRFSQLVRTYSKFVSILRARHLPAWLAWPASVVLDTGLSLRSLLEPTSGTARMFATIDELEEHLQQMWEKSKASEDMQGDFSADYIRWRYLNCPYKNYRVYGLFDERQNLVAYVVYVIEDGVVLIDDFRYIDKEWVPSLFNQLWKTARSNGCATLSAGLVMNGNIREMMTKSGFIPRSSKRWGGVLSNPEVSTDWKKMLNNSDWYITDGEIDL